MHLHTPSATSKTSWPHRLVTNHHTRDTHAVMQSHPWLQGVEDNAYVLCCCSADVHMTLKPKPRTASLRVRIVWEAGRRIGVLIHI
jgi:hypothetical protein